MSFSTLPLALTRGWNLRCCCRRLSGMVERGQFSRLQSHDIEYFRQLLGADHVLLDNLDSYNTDWLGTIRGRASTVLRPALTENVSAILAHCNRRQLAVCVQGGNTGLVGGSTPIYDEIILSMTRMNNIISLDSTSGVVVCQAGCVLEALDSVLAQNGLTVPLDLGSKGSCQLGGNVSTNAGGLRLLRYGNLHGSVLGLEVVLSDGTMLDCMSTLRKDNTGYHLRHLFIGAEGTLGVVTAVSLACPRRSSSRHLLLLGLSRFESVLRVYELAQKHLGEILSSVEFMDQMSQHCLCNNLQVSHPMPGHNYYLLIESSGSCEKHDAEKIDCLSESVLSQGLAQDGIRAASQSQLKDLWALRERITEALSREGHNYKYDISLPLSCFYSAVEVMRQRLSEELVITCCGYGHIGDGNLHLNITSSQFSARLLAKIEPFLYEWVGERGGSISAEHGLGVKKNDFIGLTKTPEAIAVMKSIKHLFDPKGILNPYKVLPS